MLIVVGLGNPGAEYAHTHHNIGFDVVDALAKDLGIAFSKKKFKALVGEGFFGGEKIMLVKPQTFMNLSGECVALVKQKFQDARILVVVDDIDLPRGTLRFRERGSGGTHNGLRNIVAHIGEDFERLKVGIGKNENIELVDFVLAKYEQEFFAPVIASAVEQIKAKI